MTRNFAVPLVFAVLFAIPKAPAFADGMDYFFNKTPGGKGKSPVVMPFPSFPSESAGKAADLKGDAGTSPSNALPPKQLALKWFEKFDDIIFTMGPTDHEKYILKRPINQEAERLQEWIDATNSMAKKYLLIAKRIRAMRPAREISDIDEFQTEAAEWYEDNAKMCLDLTVPRPVAKTYEELERAYQQFMQRKKNLASVAKTVTTLNTQLREKYDVHQPKYTDQSAKFIDSVANSIKEK
jgi:hypothetical protein